MSAIEIIPAVLPKDFAEVEEKVAMVKGLVKTVQIDVCDGQFSPIPTWPYRKHDDSFERIIHEQEGLPGWEDLNFEIDLMANEPQSVVDDWVTAGASRVIIHIESKGDIAGALASLEGRVEAGLALGTDTPLAEASKHLEHIAFIQLMGIDNVGFQRQPFDEKVLGRVKEARIMFGGLPISVDGGVSLETAEGLIAAGADRLVVGSAIFETDNPIEAVENLKRLA